jgi:predicted acetyltransferase
MKSKLVIRKPDYKYIDALIDMSKDYKARNEPFYNFENVDAAYKRIDIDINYENGIVPVGKLQGFTYWFFIGDVLIGTSRLRPKLNEQFIIKGGNIGYDVSPSYRKQGFGTEILRLTLLRAKDMGLSKVLITCDDDNVGSIKVIENNNGKLVNKIEFGDNNTLIRRYEIVLS